MREFREIREKAGNQGLGMEKQNEEGAAQTTPGTRFHEIMEMKFGEISEIAGFST